MTQASGNVAISPPHSFLNDGLLRRTTPTMVFVGTPEEATDVVRQLHAGYLPELVAAAGPGSKLLGLDGATIVPSAADFCAELTAGQHWLVITNIGALLDSPGGRLLLDTLCESIAKAELPFVAVTATPSDVGRLHSEAIRFSGLARVFPMSAAPAGIPAGELGYLVMQSADPRDVGWLISVRTVLTAPRIDSRTHLGAAADQAMRKVETLQAVGSDTVPTGILASFVNGAFTQAQQEEAFAAAELVAHRIVGRPLKENESIEARRGVFYTPSKPRIT